MFASKTVKIMCFMRRFSLLSVAGRFQERETAISFPYNLKYVLVVSPLISTVGVVRME